MKKLFNFRLLVLIGVLITSINQAWAYVNGGAYLYFNPDGQWSYTKYYFAAIKEHDSWQTQVYEMNNIAHTNLYFLSTTEWNDADYITIGAQNGEFSGGYWGYNDFKSYITMCGEKCNWGLDYTKTYTFKPSADSKGTSINPTYHSGGYSDLNNRQTVDKYTSTNNGYSYSKSSTNSGEVTISAYKMTGNGTASNTSNSATFDEASELSAYVDAAYTGEVTLTASANVGYVFVGWFDTSDSPISTDNPYTYNAPNSTKTIRARFKNEAVHQVTVSYTCTSPSITVKDTETPYVGEITSSTFEAGTPKGFSFTGWTVGNGLTITAGSAATNSISVTTKASGSYTLTANYSEVLTSTYKLKGAFDSWGSGVAMLKKTGHSTEDWVYCTRSFTGSESTTAIKIDDGSAYHGAADAVNTLTKQTGSLTSSNWSCSSPGNNINFKHNWTGTYEFAYNTSTNTFYVTYPEVDQLRISAASPADATNVNNFNLGVAVSNVRSVTRTLNANTTYTFKIVYLSDWYGNNSGAFTRSNSTSSNSITLNTSGGDLTLTTDYAGDYTFKFNQSDKSLSVDFPAAYKVTYGKGTIDGSSSDCSAKDIDNGDAAVTSNSTWVKSGNRVVLTAPAAKGGYTYDGWFANNAGTGDAITTNANCTITVSSALTRYACYHENDYTVTVNAGTGGKVDDLSSTTVTGHKDTQADLPTATADPGYYFVNWTTSAGTLTNDESATTGKINGLTSTATVTANFAPIWRVACSSDSHNTESHQITTITASEGVMTSGSVTIDLNANTDYDLKIFNKPNNKWWGHSGDVTEITYTNKATAQSLAENTGSNQTFHTAGKGTYTFTWDVTNSKISIGYPTSYTVTFGEGTGNGTAVTASVESSGAITSGQYAAAGKDITFSQAAHEGYTFAGWYTASSGGTTVTGMSTSDHVYDDIATDISVYAQYTANNYTVTFNAGSGTCGTASKSVTYGSAYGTLPTATPPGDDKFIGWYTTATDDPVVGTRITAETTVSTADDHTLYARYETTYEVIVQFKCGSDVLYPQTKVNASESSLSPTISAPEIFGYNFSGWTESGGNSYVDFEDVGEATTTITATGSATIVANYTVVPTVYFKNNLGWENVYVTFDNTWSNSAPCNDGKPYFQMTQIGSSDIFYCEIPSTYTASDYAGWAWNIAFDNTGFSASENVGAKSGGFDEGEFVGRGDFDPKATMFIPYNGETETRNGGTYYPTGCWIQYNTNYSGYKVRVNTYVQGSGGTETANVELRSSIAGSTEFTATANLTNANFTYGFMLWKEHLKNTNDTLYTNVNDEENTITSATTSLPWAFEPCTGTWQRCRIHTEATGDYKFTVSFATGKPMVDIEYPVVVGDWKLIYKDRATWSNDAHTASWCHPSRVIKAKVDALDTISFFVAYGSTPSIELYKCTAIDALTSAQTWTKQEDVSLTGITAKGYYNFLVSQNGSKEVTSVTNLGAYSGNFYIRTDASDGGWSNYKSSKNEMTYSEYADTKKDFTHYFMRYVTNGSNIKFCIANDYNECISDTLEGDSYSGQYMAADGNVRFMWEKSTNTISRAYISGSSNVSDRFLVLEGDAKMFDENGNALTTAGGGKITGLNDYEMKFTDDQNWVYEATIKAQPTARVKLTAKFNNKIQYFYGAEGERSSSTTHEIIGGSDEDETAYKLRIVYDFKIDRLVSAFLPEDAINSALAINADMMIIRDHQEGANQVTFGAKGSLSEVHTVYGAMKFNKYTVNNKLRTGSHGNAGLSPYERGLYWISFPFDVKLGDVFGFGTYYTHWAIEYYDGQERARDGYWADSDGFWKLVPKSQLNTFTLKAFEGYVLALDLDAMTESSSVWNNGVENVYLYFPSDGDVENISATELTVPISQDGYVCTIDRRTDKETPNTNKDRRIMDSYWHIIGTPSFADYTTTLYGSKGGTVIDWTTGSLPYLYVWNKSTNAYTISSSANHSFLAMHSYMVQYSGTSIYWSSVNVTPASVAARVQDMPDTEYKLSLVKDSIEEDHTYVRMTDDVNVTTAFEFNFDVTKVTNSGQGNIWTVTSDVVPVAGNSQPHPLTTTIVPVGVKIAANGEYTFSMPEGTNGGDVWLIDNANSSRTNLGLMDYTVNLTTGTYEGRFSLEFPVQNVVTEIENAANANANANADDAVRKVFVGGRLYILRDGKAYDATGAQVR